MRRFSLLANKLDISRGILNASLERLIGSGIVERNPSHGHPLRPEYLLTQRGIELAPFCHELVNISHRPSLQEALIHKWSYPIIFFTGYQERRFGEIKTMLNTVTSRALSENLQQLVDAQGLEKEIIKISPLTAIYKLRKKSFPIYKIYKDHESLMKNYCFPKFGG